jgi:hypothetical protein
MQEYQVKCERRKKIRIMMQNATCIHWLSSSNVELKNSNLGPEAAGAPGLSKHGSGLIWTAGAGRTLEQVKILRNWS